MAARGAVLDGGLGGSLTDLCGVWYTVPMDSKTNTTHLQGIGRVPAVPAADLTIGDTIIYNYGYRSVVCGIIAKGKTQLIVHTASTKGGFYSSVISRTRLVAVAR